MRKMQLLMLAAGLIIVAGCKTAQVYHVGASPQPGWVNSNPGIYYALPKTVIDVEVTETYKTTDVYIPDRCIESVSTIYPIPGKQVRVTSQAVSVKKKSIPDVDALFIVDPNSSIIKQSGITFAYSESGTLDSVTATMQDKTFSTAVKVIGTVASVLVKGGIVNLDCNYYEDIATRLKGIVKNRQDLLTSPGASSVTGRTASEVEQYKLSMENLDAEKAKLEKELFEQKTGTRTEHAELIPEAYNATRPSSFSKEFGNYSVEWSATETNNIARKLEKLSATSMNMGFYYRVPVVGKLKVYAEGKDAPERKLLWQGDMAVAQQGTLLALPADYPASEVTQTLTFYPDTGALKTLDIQSKALKSEDITSAVDMANGIISAAKAKDAAQELADDELTKLKRQKDILQLQSEIKALQEE